MTSDAQTLDRPATAAPGQLDEHTFDLVTAILLATAALASAWSAYQATRWSGEQANNYSRASAQRTESLRAANRAAQQIQVDVTTFTTWVMARGENKLRLAEFLRTRFRREFAPAFEAWLQSAPGAIPAGTPFERPEYQVAAQREATRLTGEADAATEAARRANQLSDNFVFAVVLFTVVVFFGGIQTKTDSLWLRRTLLGLAGLILIIALFLMLRLPQNIGF
jgi:hypothetical protein